MADSRQRSAVTLNQISRYAERPTFGKDPGGAFIGLELVGYVKLCGISRHRAGSFQADMPVAPLILKQLIAPHRGRERVVLGNGVGVGGNILKFKPVVAEANPAKIEYILQFRPPSHNVGSFMALKIAGTKGLDG